MDADRYQFCRIFLRQAEPDAVARDLAAALGLRFEHHVAALPGLEVEVRRNPDRHDPRPALPNDEFLVWPVNVELEATAPDAGRAMVATTTAILEHLWRAGDAVAACDYEDELPWSGGLHRPRTST